VRLMFQIQTPSLIQADSSRQSPQRIPFRLTGRTKMRLNKNYVFDSIGPGPADGRAR
jgi:hypothetical protein